MSGVGMESRPNGPALVLRRQATAFTWVSIAVIVASLLLVARQLPIGSALEALEGWIKGLGLLGPLVFGMIYVLAVVLMAPASVLTLAGGAFFGLLVGTITVSLASTIGAAFAFLVSRYLARDAVARKFGRQPKFAAIDRAIGENGWKIVALLRLSPAVPFNLQNYLYGLTGIRFWTYVLTSWIAMLPGTFLYVYLGYAGRVGLEAAASGERSRTPAEWGMIVVGLLATAAVTVYVTRLARRAMEQKGELAKIETQAETDQKDPEVSTETEVAGQNRWPWRPTIAAALAVLAISVAVTVQVKLNVFENLVMGLFGPPQVTLKEVYESKPDGPSFEHSGFDTVVKEYVQPGGWVDYQALLKDSEPLDAYIETLANAPFDDFGRNEKLALLMNAYNAFTLKLILEHYPIDSIQSIPTDKRWEAQRWRIGPHTWSLNQIEHEQIRPKFVEPRIHFALVCAAVGCPPLRTEAFEADRLEEQLEDQTRYVHTHDRWFQITPDARAVGLTSLYKWYGGDFEQVAGSVLDYAARYVPELKQAIDSGRHPDIQWLEYDWTLNSVENKEKVR